MCEPIKQPDGSEGQQPCWPGEETKGPGTERDPEHDEETIIPVVQ